MIVRRRGLFIFEFCVFCDRVLSSHAYILPILYSQSKHNFHLGVDEAFPSYAEAHLYPSHFLRMLLAGAARGV
jgi:hypothetical protein